MFPLRDHNPTEIFPIFTIVIGLLTVAAWILVQCLATTSWWRRRGTAWYWPGRILITTAGGDLVRVCLRAWFEAMSGARRWPASHRTSGPVPD